MKTAPHSISAENAADLITHGKPLIDLHVKGTLNLYSLKEQIKSELIMQNCIVEDLVSPSIEFEHPVRITGSTIVKCSFNYAYFLAGLTIDHSTFNSYVDFEFGGHNQNNSPLTITNSTFEEFVNFFDCWFKSEVIISHNHFVKGTNLLGNMDDSYRTHFEVEPVIENNRGAIDLDGEGDKKVNTIYLRNPE